MTEELLVKMKERIEFLVWAMIQRNINMINTSNGVVTQRDFTIILTAIKITIYEKSVKDESKRKYDYDKVMKTTNEVWQLIKGSSVATNHLLKSCCL